MTAREALRSSKAGRPAFRLILQRSFSAGVAVHIARSLSPRVRAYISARNGALRKYSGVGQYFFGFFRKSSTQFHVAAQVSEIS